MAATELLRTPTLRVVDLCCRAPRSGRGAERGGEAAHLALLRRGAFVYHLGARPYLGDASTALLHVDAGSYRVSHPGPDGDDVTVVELSAGLAAELFGRSRRVAWPVPAPTQLRHHRLLGALARGAPDALAAEEAVLALVEEVARGGSTAPATSPRDRRLVQAAKERLHASLDRNLAVTDVAAALGVSPFHLMRTFRAATGRTMRAYRRRLRVLDALDRISAGEGDLAAIAVRAGFAHHAHLTDAFRRELGAPPSAVRGDLGVAPSRARRIVEASRREGP